MQLASVLAVTLLTAVAATPRAARRAVPPRADGDSVRFFFAGGAPNARRRALVACTVQRARAATGTAAAGGVGHWLAGAVREAFAPTADAHGVNWAGTAMPYTGTPLHASDHTRLARVEQCIGAARAQLLAEHAVGTSSAGAPAAAPGARATAATDMGARQAACQRACGAHAARARALGARPALAVPSRPPTAPTSL
jgi:hypothetical protein